MPQKHTVEIPADNPRRFEPHDITIAQGDTVEWVNKHPHVHTVTAEGDEFPAKNPFLTGETYAVVIDAEPGVINYFCEFHGEMTGTITVNAKPMYTRERAIEFWFNFDNAFLFQPAQEILQAYQQIGGPDAFRRLFVLTRANGTYPAAFEQQAQAARDGLLRLTDAQLANMDRHFPNEPESLRQAFEDFGQGVLFDDRRNVGDKVHKMDIGGPQFPPIGYHRWHGFIRAAVAAGADTERWLFLNRCVGLAWHIQSLAKPEEDNPNNPGLPEEQRASLRERWMAMSVDELDAAFDSTPFPPEDLVA
jgi:Copper binding proteins, plastocyanin/azurin family